MKGYYTINKYRGELVDGEWVKKELIETIKDQENLITPLLAFQLWAYTWGQDRRIDYVIVGVSEQKFVGARTLEGTSNQSIRAAVNINAFHTPAGVGDAFWTIDSILNPPGAGTRNLRTVFLTSAYGGANDDVYSIVNLSSPCTQSSTEILQITYKLVLDTTTLAGESRSTIANESFFKNILGTSAAGFGGNLTFLTTWGDDKWGNGIKQEAAGWYTNQSGNTEIISSGVNNDEDAAGLNVENLAKHRWYSPTITGQFGSGGNSTNNTFWCGFPVKGVSIGSSGSNAPFDGGAYAMTSVNKGTLSSVQNTFGRSADDTNPRPPFLDTAIIATSGATVSMVDRGEWINYITDSYSMPWLYRITMETGGNVGTATYKVRRRRLCRWQENDSRWEPSGIGLPMMEVNDTDVQRPHMDKTTRSETRHGQSRFANGDTSQSTYWQYANEPFTRGEANSCWQRYVYPEFITYGYEGITLNSINVEWCNVDATTTPSMPATEILQVATDGLDIYVADAGTGLYKIERDFGDFDESNFTIRTLAPPGITDATSCRGVCAKGGSMWGGPGKVIAIRVVRGGSNYAIGDAVTFAGVNGTGAAAEVGSVDANGSITSITVTNQGSGYIEDYLQTYISSTTGGLGASLEPVIGAGGNIWALFDDTTDSVMYLAHMTHVGSNDYTSLNFDTTGDTITRTGGTDFLVDGFRPGQALIVRTAEDAGNIGTFTITAVTSTVITVSENLTSNTTDTQAQIFGENWEIMRETVTDDSTSYNFNGAGDPDTITGNGTSFLTQGFREGMKIVISGSENAGENDGIFTIADVTATVITLDSQDTLVTNTADTTATIALVTDFTITNYTSGTPGRTGFIGLVMDDEHADDRFMMLTPTTKRVNDRSADSTSSDGGWDWWSYANSTGTTTAGTTDRVRVAANANNEAMAVERLAPLTVGPLSTSNHWVSTGKRNVDSGYTTWGSATAVTDTPNGPNVRYMPLRTTGAFNRSVACYGNNNNQHWCTCDDVAEMANGTSSDSILLYSFGTYYDQDLRPINLWRDGGALAYLGKGMFITPQSYAGSLGLPSGTHVWTCNGTGTLTSEDQLPYGFWEEFGWDGNDWVLGNASAKTTHAQVSFSGTSLNINATTGAIVGTGFASTDWAGDGFAVGDIITIASAEDAANNGQYTIESLSGTTLTVTPDKLPAVTNTADTLATVVGDHALIDGLAISFDDNATAAPLVVGEYYDIHLYDGILKDNATEFTFDTYFTWTGDETGTNFAPRAGGSTTTTIPNADAGAVTNIPLTALYYPGRTSGTQPINAFVEPGVAGFDSGSTSGIAFNHQIVGGTDFVVRFKCSGAYGNNEAHFGVVPWTTITDGTNTIAIGELDENIKIEYDYLNYPTHAQYIVRVRNTGNGADQLVYNADRVVTIAAQSETNFNATGSNGDFDGGSGFINSPGADDGETITLDDGTIITIDNVTAGAVDQFTISSKSTKTSGRTQRIITDDSTDLDFADNGGSPDTITGNGTSFLTLGFAPGMKIWVRSANTAANNGTYTIASVTATVITLDAGDSLTTDATDVTAVLSTALVQESTTASGSGFAMTLGTANEADADIANDQFSLHRTGTGAGNTTWRINDVEFYQYPGALHTATDMGLCYHADNTGWTNIYDASIDYEVQRRVLTVGNGTSTGTWNTNFRCLSGLVAGSDALRLYYNDGTGPVEFTYLTDGYTAPAANEVNIIAYAGELWFNSANATDTITGNWTITKRENLT